MGKMGNALKDSTETFNGLMIIGFLGIVWLMIYGNLSGNLGFTQDSLGFNNETIELNDTGQIPASAQNRVDGTLSSILLHNQSTGELIPSTNYTISGVVITTEAGDYNTTDVNVSGIVHFNSDSELNTEGVIGNLTAGANTFFTFSNVLFTITAIVLLVTLLLGLLFIVLKIAKPGGKGDREFSG